MRPPRSTAVLGVLVAALIVWLVIRPHVPPPSPSPAKDEVLTTPPSGPTPDGAQAAPTPPGAPPTAQPTPAAPTRTPVAQARSTPPPAVVPPVSSPGTVPTAAAPTAAAESASVNAIRVRRMITDYHTLTGENPVGTNAEIMAATMGRNPRQAVLGPPEGLNLNAKGELVDEWDTPYFFHQLSKDVMEIHSAGPDRIMGTADDVVVR